MPPLSFSILKRLPGLLCFLVLARTPVPLSPSRVLGSLAMTVMLTPSSYHFTGLFLDSLRSLWACDLHRPRCHSVVSQQCGSTGSSASPLLVLLYGSRSGQGLHITRRWKRVFCGMSRVSTLRYSCLVLSSLFLAGSFSSNPVPEANET